MIIEKIKTKRRAIGLGYIAACFTIGALIAAAFSDAPVATFSSWFGSMMTLVVVYFDPPQVKTIEIYREQK